MRVAGSLALPLLLGLTTASALAQPVSGRAEPAAPGNFAAPVPAPIASTGTLSLADCLQLAHQRQPRIAAERANLTAAEDAKRSLDDLHVPAVIERELPIRRCQAKLGVIAAAAGVDRAEAETVYAVTRAYYSVLYAREQERIIRSVVDRLTALHEAAKEKLKAGDKDITTADVNRVLVYLRQAQAKRIQAAQGEKRALAALNEAIGLGTDCRLDVPAGRLPDPDLHPSREDIVAQALSRRGDLVQASIFAQVACLEVEAQGTSLHLKFETFAAGSDIHSTQVPQGFHDSEYRPGAMVPAMPTLLVGSRANRVKHAESLYARATAIVEVTHNLIALEAEDAFLRWEEAALQVPPARESADTADKVADDLTRDYNANLKVRTEEVVTARVLAAQVRAQYNEYLYHKILALADLERITDGGFCVKWADAPRPAPRDGNGNK
jgi:outer membrane protein TolC